MKDISDNICNSEYVEGSSNNKALEFFNCTCSATDLTAGNYVVQMYLDAVVLKKGGTSGIILDPYQTRTS